MKRVDSMSISPALWWGGWRIDLMALKHHARQGYHTFQKGFQHTPVTALESYYTNERRTKPNDLVS